MKRAPKSDTPASQGFKGTSRLAKEVLSACLSTLQDARSDVTDILTAIHEGHMPCDQDAINALRSLRNAEADVLETLAYEREGAAHADVTGARARGGAVT